MERRRPRCWRVTHLGLSSARRFSTLRQEVSYCHFNNNLHLFCLHALQWAPSGSSSRRLCDMLNVNDACRSSTIFCHQVYRSIYGCKVSIHSLSLIVNEGFCWLHFFNRPSYRTESYKPEAGCYTRVYETSYFTKIINTYVIY